MKNLSLFVTLSLLTLMGTCTIVKANLAEDNFEQSQYPNSVILSQENTDDVTDDVPVTDDVTDDVPVTDDVTDDVPDEMTDEVPDEMTDTN